MPFRGQICATRSIHNLGRSHARLMIEDSKIQTEVFPEIFDEI
jgi:hypothetical protein